MIGTELDSHGMIVNGHREDWKSGASFITPAALTRTVRDAYG